MEAIKMKTVIKRGIIMFSFLVFLFTMGTKVTIDAEDVQRNDVNSYLQISHVLERISIQQKAGRQLKETVIAILGDGIDAGHEEFKDRIVGDLDCTSGTCLENANGHKGENQRRRLDSAPHKQPFQRIALLYRLFPRNRPLEDEPAGCICRRIAVRAAAHGPREAAIQCPRIQTRGHRNVVPSAQQRGAHLPHRSAQVHKEHMAGHRRIQPARHQQRKLILLGERCQQQQLRRAKLPHRQADKLQGTGRIVTKIKRFPQPLFSARYSGEGLNLGRNILYYLEQFVKQTIV